MWLTLKKWLILAPLCFVFSVLCGYSMVGILQVIAE